MKNRRAFIKNTVAITGFLSLVGVELALSNSLAARFKKEKKAILRPPMAVNEELFMDLCLKCGQCLQVCPYNSIRLFDAKKGYLSGTPYINPDFRGCYLCALLPCVLACPSAALSHDFKSVKSVNMGKAVVINKNACLAKNKQKLSFDDIKPLYKSSAFISESERKSYELEDRANPSQKRALEMALIKRAKDMVGKSCSLCADLCPYPNPLKAIAMQASQDGQLLPVIKDECVGCGACAQLCPKDVIIIKPKESL